MLLWRTGVRLDRVEAALGSRDGRRARVGRRLLVDHPGPGRGQVFATEAVARRALHVGHAVEERLDGGVCVAAGRRVPRVRALALGLREEAQVTLLIPVVVLDAARARAPLRESL